MALSLFSAGCSCFSDWRYDLDYHRQAAVAWNRYGDAPPNGSCLRDFYHGWKDGYYDVARGKNGCPPAVPPEKYWSLKYRNSAGQRAIQAWYTGYQLGAIAAEKDGLKGQSRVPSAPPHLMPNGPEEIPPGEKVEAASVDRGHVRLANSQQPIPAGTTDTNAGSASVGVAIYYQPATNPAVTRLPTASDPPFSPSVTTADGSPLGASPLIPPVKQP
jgi:hypothetical protein